MYFLTTADIIQFPANPSGRSNSDVEVIENGNTVLAMATSLKLPDALRWAADVLEGKAKGPAE